MRPTIRLHYLALAAVLAGVRVALPAEPNIELEKNSWDFGEVTQGRQLSHTLAIYNHGDAALVIGSVRTSCSVCSAAMVDAKVIPPGGRAKLNIRFYTARASGRQHKSLIISSNDPDEPFAKVSVTGTVVKRKRAVIELKPKVWDVGLVALGQTCVGVIQVRNRGDGPLDLQGIQCSTGCRIVAWPKKPIPPGRGAAIRLALDTTDMKGLVQGYIQVESNDPAAPTKLLQIIGYVAPRGSGPSRANGLAFTVLELGPLAPGKGRLVARYRVVNGLGKGVKLRAVEAPGAAALSPKELDLPPGASAELRVELPADFTFDGPSSQAALTIRLPVVAGTK